MAAPDSFSHKPALMLSFGWFVRRLFGSSL